MKNKKYLMGIQTLDYCVERFVSLPTRVNSRAQQYCTLLEQVKSSSS